MNKIFFTKNILIRKEHFGTLILLPDWKRFEVANKYFKLLKIINSKNTINITKLVDLSEKEVDNFVKTCLEKWILTKKRELSKVRIIDNNYISEDCLSFPRTVYREATRNCNYQCIHCYSLSWKELHKDMPFKVIKKMINEMVRYWVEFFNIWWWEPILYNGIYDTIDYCKKKWLSLEITTNWSLLNNGVIKKLKKSWLKYIQISLDWSTQEIYWKIRIGGKLKIVIENIKKLIKGWFVVSICTVVNKINLEDIDNIINLCIDLWINYYRILPFIEVWRGNEITSLQLDKEQFRNLYKNILSKEKETLKWLKISFNENLVIPIIKNIHWMPEKHYWCSAWRTTCWIDTYWNVYPCSYMTYKELICGNILNESLLNIWKYSNIMEEIRNIKSIWGKCKDCEHLGICRWWCRAAAYSKTKCLDSQDPLCSII